MIKGGITPAVQPISQLVQKIVRMTGLTARAQLSGGSWNADAIDEQVH